MSGFNPSLRFLSGFVNGIKEGKNVLQAGENVDGVNLIFSVSADRIAEQREKMPIRPDDVFITSYPKCGMTWTQQIVKLITNNGVDNGINDDIVIPWHEYMSLEELESMSSPRIFKSHLPYNLMPGGGDPENTNAKYIYIMHNPKDVSVSLYNLLKMLFPPEHLPPLDLVVDSFMEGSIATNGPFYSHFLGWWGHRDASNILILTYEQMKRNPHSTVSTIAKFLGYKLSDKVVNQIAVASSFDKMKENKAANKKYFEEILPGDGKFMNKGIIGNWKSILTEEQSAKIDALVAEKLKGSGIVFDYGDD